MKLLYTLTSPYARKVRVVAAEKRIEIEMLKVALADPACPVIQYNPLGKIPVLVLDDGESLFDSRVIVEYLDTLSPVGRLIPQDGRERAAIKCWEAMADGVLDAAVAIFIENNRRAPALRDPVWVERQQRKITATLDVMNQSLGENTFCRGVSLSLADIAVGCALAYLDLRFPDIEWRARGAHLARLYDDRLVQRPSFTNTRPPAA